MKDAQGRQVYLSYKPGALFYDAQTQYNSTLGQWELEINTFGAGYVLRFLSLVDSDDFANLDGVTYDALRDWVYQGWQMYEDSLHTTWSDFTRFNEGAERSSTTKVNPTAALLLGHQSNTMNSAQDVSGVVV